MTATDEPAGERGDASPGRLEPMLATLGSLDALGLDREWGCEMLHGEIVGFDEQGRPTFRRLQKRMHGADAAAAQRLSRSDPAVSPFVEVPGPDAREVPAYRIHALPKPSVTAWPANH